MPIDSTPSEICRFRGHYTLLRHMKALDELEGLAQQRRVPLEAWKSVRSWYVEQMCSSEVEASVWHITRH